MITQEEKGFTLIEMSIVLVIIGLVLVGSITLFRSSIGTAKLSATKTNLENIKNAVINFAIANGRLPCPDSTAPPNNAGKSTPDPTWVQTPSPGFCINNTCLSNNNCNCNCATYCTTQPCYMPFQTLQLQLPGGKDGYGNVIRYDINYETTAGSGLTNTTQDTFCGVLFEYLNHATDVVPPASTPAPVPIVTNTNDTINNGIIGSAGQGYGVAAVIISETPTENLFNVPATLRGLNDKNVVGTDREYEMANRENSKIYGNVVAELTYNELYNKVCTAQKTKIRIQNYTGSTKYIQFSGTTTCISIPPATSTTGYVDLPQGGTITFYDCQGACQGQCTSCSSCTGCTGTTCTSCSTCANSTGCTTLSNCTNCAGTSCSSCTCNSQCGSPVTFNMTGSNDAGTKDWNIIAGNIPRDGRVQITGACALSDNTSSTP